MIIGIDISQIVYKGTGVGRYVERMVREVIIQGAYHRYVLFGSSLRQRHVFYEFFSSLPDEAKRRVALKVFPLPPTLLAFMWNTLHVVPVEWLIGDIDVFWSSDWTQPPLAKAKGVTTIHDLTVYRFPESFSLNIVRTHRQKLQRSKTACAHFLCDSEATRHDAHEFLGIPLKSMTVVYPGFDAL